MTICNKDNETPIDKTTGEVHEKLLRLAQEMNQDLQSKTAYKVSQISRRITLPVYLIILTNG